MPHGLSSSKLFGEPYAKHPMAKFKSFLARLSDGGTILSEEKEKRDKMGNGGYSYAEDIFRRWKKNNGKNTARYSRKRGQKDEHPVEIYTSNYWRGKEMVVVAREGGTVEESPEEVLAQLAALGSDAEDELEMAGGSMDSSESVARVLKLREIHEARVSEDATSNATFVENDVDESDAQLPPQYYSAYEDVAEEQSTEADIIAPESPELHAFARASDESEPSADYSTTASDDRSESARMASHDSGDRASADGRITPDSHVAQAEDDMQLSPIATRNPFANLTGSTTSLVNHASVDHAAQPDDGSSSSSGTVSEEAANGDERLDMPAAHVIEDSSVKSNDSVIAEMDPYTPPLFTETSPDDVISVDADVHEINSDAEQGQSVASSFHIVDLYGTSTDVDDTIIPDHALGFSETEADPSGYNSDMLTMNIRSAFLEATIADEIDETMELDAATDIHGNKSEGLSGNNSLRSGSPMEDQPPPTPVVAQNADDNSTASIPPLNDAFSPQAPARIPGVSLPLKATHAADLIPPPRVRRSVSLEIIRLRSLEVCRNSMDVSRHQSHAQNLSDDEDEDDDHVPLGRKVNYSTASLPLPGRGPFARSPVRNMEATSMKIDSQEKDTPQQENDISAKKTSKLNACLKWVRNLVSGGRRKDKETKRMDKGKQKETKMHPLVVLDVSSGKPPVEFPMHHDSQARRSGQASNSDRRPISAGESAYGRSYITQDVSEIGASAISTPADSTMSAKSNRSINLGSESGERSERKTIFRRRSGLSSNGGSLKAIQVEEGQKGVTVDGCDERHGHESDDDTYASSDTFTLHSRVSEISLELPSLPKIGSLEVDIPPPPMRTEVPMPTLPDLNDLTFGDDNADEVQDHEKEEAIDLLIRRSIIDETVKAVRETAAAAVHRPAATTGNGDRVYKWASQSEGNRSKLSLTSGEASLDDGCQSGASCSTATKSRKTSSETNRGFRHLPSPAASPDFFSELDVHSILSSIDGEYKNTSEESTATSSVDQLGKLYHDICVAGLGLDELAGKYDLGQRSQNSSPSPSNSWIHLDSPKANHNQPYIQPTATDQWRENIARALKATTAARHAALQREYQQSRPKHPLPAHVLPRHSVSARSVWSLDERLADAVVGDGEGHDLAGVIGLALAMGEGKL